MNTQQGRAAYREHIGGFHRTGKNYGKPYLKSGWKWRKVRFLAGGPAYPNGYVELNVHPAHYDAMRALAAVLFHYRYPFLETAGGTAVLRNITGAKKSSIDKQVAEQYPYATSIHAHGAALDINPSRNPYGAGWDELEEGRYSHVPPAVKKIKTVDGHTVFRWGGDWSNDDAMHFESIGCTRAQLERGIDLNTVIGWNEYTAWTGGNDQMMLTKGSKGREVAEAQKAMADFFGQDNGDWDPYPGKSVFDGKSFGPGEDGDFGSTCEANTKAVQKTLGLGQTGIIDQLLWDALMARYSTGAHDHDGRYVKSVTVKK